VGFEDTCRKMRHIGAEAVGRGWRECKIVVEDGAGEFRFGKVTLALWCGFRLRAEDLC